MRVSALKDLAAIVCLSSLSNWENEERRTIVAISQRQKSPCPHQALGPNHTTPPRKPYVGCPLRCRIVWFGFKTAFNADARVRRT